MKGILKCSALALQFILLNAAVGATVGNEKIDRCLEAISRVKSYDVSYRLDTLEFTNCNDKVGSPNPSQVWQSETNRDVFTYGQGHRLEYRIGDKDLAEIAVIDWASATSNGQLLPEIWRISLSGLAYGDYLTFFLTNGLQDSKVTITSLGIDQGQNFASFEVYNPSHSQRIRFWLDGSHGNRPARIETYMKSEEEAFVLAETIEITEFFRLQDGSWVPSLATLTRFSPRLKGAEPRAYSGFVMTVNPGESSWNRANAPELFLARSLPKVDESIKGWKYYYAPILLKERQYAQEVSALPITR